MIVTCHKCGRKWDYKGKSAFVVSCSRCRIKTWVFIEENLKYAKKAICPVCNKEFYKKDSRNVYCSTECWQTNTSRLGAKAFHEKHSQKGSNNHNWKGGITKNKVHYREIQKERYPEKVRCREIAWKAVKRGKIIRPTVCESCGDTDEK